MSQGNRVFRKMFSLGHTAQIISMSISQLYMQVPLPQIYYPQKFLQLWYVGVIISMARCPGHKINRITRLSIAITVSTGC